MIILHSNHGFAKKPKPNNGKLVTISGTTAQRIAHIADAVIPILSSLLINFRRSILQIYNQMQHDCI